MRFDEDRVFGGVLALMLLAAVVWIVVALFTSADLDSSTSGFLRYGLLIGLAGVLGLGAAHYLGEDRGFAVFLAALLVGAAAWIVVALLTSVDFTPGQATAVRYGLLVGLAILLGVVAAQRFGEDRGFGVFLAALFAGATIWIVVALASSLELDADSRQNFGYVLFFAIPIAAGFVLMLWWDAREQRSGQDDTKASSRA
jgi:hypothetical protein